MKILLIEDDNPIARGLEKALEHHGYTVERTASGRHALERVAVAAPDLLILDLGLPDMEGTEVLKQVRGRPEPLPVLILTARHSTDTLVAALDLGADDYLKKPFETAELLARVRALGRRHHQQKSNSLSVNGVTLDLAAVQVQVNDLPVSLARREFMLLKALMMNVDRVQTRDALEQKLYSWNEELASNAIEAHISNLRKKLPEGFIKTVRGVGYIVRKNTSS